MRVLDIRTSVLTMYQNRSISDDTFDVCLQAALNIYNQYNPRRLETVLKTVARQEEYDLQELLGNDFIQVTDVVWYPGESVSFSTLIDFEDRRVYYLPYYDQPSLRVVERINRDQAISSAKGTWEVRDRKLCLYPTPSVTGQEVLVCYAASHVFNDTGTELPTVPDNDRTNIRDLVLAELIEQHMLEHSLEPNYQEGQGSITRQYAAMNTKYVSQILRDRAVAKYRRSVALS